MTEVISVRFRGGCKNYYFNPNGNQVKMGDQVIVETAQGPEFATCTEGNHEVEDEVFALTDRLMHPYIEAEDLGLVLVRFKNGSYGVIEGTTNIYPHNLEETLYLFGSTGTVKAGGKSVNTIEEWTFADDENDSQAVKDEFCENPPNVYGFGHKPLYGDMIRAIREDRNPYVDGEAGLRAVEMVLAIYLSAATGKPVKLPLEHCSTLDFVGRF